MQIERMLLSVQTEIVKSIHTSDEWLSRYQANRKADVSESGFPRRGISRRSSSIPLAPVPHFILKYFSDVHGYNIIYTSGAIKADTWSLWFVVFNFILSETLGPGRDSQTGYPLSYFLQMEF